MLTGQDFLAIDASKILQQGFRITVGLLVDGRGGHLVGSSLC